MTYKFFFSYTSLKEGVNTRKREPQQVASTKSRVMVDICHILPRHAGCGSLRYNGCGARYQIRPSLSVSCVTNLCSPVMWF
jgi:hypothetical protein